MTKNWVHRDYKVANKVDNVETFEEDILAIDKSVNELKNILLQMPKKHKH
jgi:hypothetical protein